jgi:hypothetical protein
MAQGETEFQLSHFDIYMGVVLFAISSIFVKLKQLMRARWSVSNKLEKEGVWDGHRSSIRRPTQDQA